MGPRRPPQGSAKIATVFVAEPTAAYARRPRLVVDASLLAAPLFGEVARDQAEAQMRGRRLCAPSLIDFELGNVAITKVQSGILPLPVVQRAMSLFAEIDLERHPVDPAALLEIGVRFAITAYDAAYLHVAASLAAPLATFDRRLARAAAILLSEPRASRD